MAGPGTSDLLISGLMIWFLLAPSGKPWLPLLILLLAIGGILAGCFWLPEASRHWQWPQRTLLAVQETPYSVWAVTREAEQLSLAANGLWYFSYPDPQTAEEQVHYALLQHPRPERVLLLGPGVAGLAAEILKSPCPHPVGLRGARSPTHCPGQANIAPGGFAAFSGSPVTGFL